MTWVQITPSLPSEIQDVGSAVSQALNTIRTALEVVRTQARAMALLAIETESAAVAATQMALDAMINAINNALNNLLDDSGLYVLAIPLPKKGLARLIPDAADSTPSSDPTDTPRASSNYVTLPTANVLAQASPMERVILENNPTLHQILYPSDLFAGGNAHIVKTIVEALYDGQDPNRPKFESGSTWGYALFVAGATDVASILQVAGYFDRLIGGGRGANYVGAGGELANLVPQGVSVTPSGRDGYAIVQWDLVPVTRLLQSYDGSQVIATKYAIIRSTDLRAFTAQRVTDLFSTRDLTTNLTGRYGSKVLTVRNYDGVLTRYVDNSTLDPGTTYYYHVAFATKIIPVLAPTPGSDQAVDPSVYELGFDHLSNGVQFRRPSSQAHYSTSRLGKAPDWMRTPNVAALIPPLGRFLDQVQEYVRSVQSTARNIRTQNDDYMEFLSAEINRYAAKIAAFEQGLSAIGSVFETPTAGVYGTLRSGTGGVSSFMADLVTALQDDSDPNRPPFDAGDEFTTGTILLAVGPDHAPILAAFELLKALFDPMSDDDPALAGIQSINTELATAEADLVARITGGTNNTATPQVAFTPAMTPTNTSCT